MYSLPATSVGGHVHAVPANDSNIKSYIQHADDNNGNSSSNHTDTNSVVCQLQITMPAESCLDVIKG